LPPEAAIIGPAPLASSIAGNVAPEEILAAVFDR
jgi:hypothetical protein